MWVSYDRSLEMGLILSPGCLLTVGLYMVYCMLALLEVTEQTHMHLIGLRRSLARLSSYLVWQVLF